jgi:hypothetical protein
VNAIGLAFGDEGSARGQLGVHRLHAGSRRSRGPALATWFTTPWSARGEPAERRERRNDLWRRRRTEWPGHRESWRDLPWDGDASA